MCAGLTGAVVVGWDWLDRSRGRADEDVPKSCLLGPVTDDDALVVVEYSYCDGIKEGGASMVTHLAKGYKGAITF
jgi:hypothetical protein